MLQDGRRKKERVKKKCLSYNIEQVLARRNKAEQRKGPKLCWRPAGLAVAGKQHMCRIGKIK